MTTTYIPIRRLLWVHGYAGGYVGQHLSLHDGRSDPKCQCIARCAILSPPKSDVNQANSRSVHRLLDSILILFHRASKQPLLCATPYDTIDTQQGPNLRRAPMNETSSRSGPSHPIADRQYTTVSLVEN